MNTNPCARNPLKSIGTLKESLGRDAMVYLTSESAYSIQVHTQSESNAAAKRQKLAQAIAYD